MIFVLLGTQDSPFPRILEETEHAIRELGITEEVYAQTGTTDYKSLRLITKDYFVGQEYDDLFTNARLILAHGGAGVLFKAIHLGKKVIALPRLAVFGEHNDSHQVELVEKLAKSGYIYWAKDSILNALKEIDNFTPKAYDLENNVVEAVQMFIDE